MKHLPLMIACVSVLALAGCSVPQITTPAPTGQTESGITQTSEHIDITTLPMGELSEQETAGLLQMREEEKLARDVYTHLGALWGQQTFVNISSSEQSHMDEVKLLLDRYNLIDPVGSDTPGVFSSTQLQKLYTDLIRKGSLSLADALQVGATIEDLDIMDLQDLSQSTDNQDISVVYQNLLKGSYNHLRAFVKNIERNGGTYIPQYITSTTYQEIISTPATGQGNKGQGMRK